MTPDSNNKKTFPPGLKLVGIIFFSLFVAGLSVALLIMVDTIIDAKLYKQDFCFSNSCVKYFLETTDQSILILKATTDLAVAVATAGGIFVALMSYFNTATTAALTNHIEHLKVFREYLDSEIEKRDRVSSKSIDALLLYNFIFHQSRAGKTSISEEYINIIRKINLSIDYSNKKCTIGERGGFSYRDHQRAIKTLLAPMGITTYLAPRNDYFEMEEQIFSLIHRINQSFCQPGVVPSIAERNYR